MNVLRPFDPWKSPLCTCPPKYSLHPYTGCSHYCLYCYATSYVGRKPSRPKKDFLKRLRRDLARADPSLPVDMSTSSDPYPPEEMVLGLTRASLEMLRSKGFRVLLTTKGVGFTRDQGLFDGLMVTITTLDRELTSKLEPFAPPPSSRLDALASVEVRKGVRVDPIIPELTDDLRDLKELLREIRDSGAEHVVFSTYKAKPDNFTRMVLSFHDLADVWRHLYYDEGVMVGGYRYMPTSNRYRLLRFAVEEALKLGMTASVCREGFKDLMRAPSCDGTHLLPQRSEHLSDIM
ncbi:MAG: radical SAM protein [Candidatus Korarchaeota archaeon]|nr:radical SAM protein [Candidatus Korarchaeota archaeon]